MTVCLTFFVSVFLPTMLAVVEPGLTVEAKTETLEEGVWPAQEVSQILSERAVSDEPIRAPRSAGPLGDFGRVCAVVVFASVVLVMLALLRQQRRGYSKKSAVRGPSLPVSLVSLGLLLPRCCSSSDSRQAEGQ